MAPKRDNIHCSSRTISAGVPAFPRLPTSIHTLILARSCNQRRRSGRRWVVKEKTSGLCPEPHWGIMPQTPISNRIPCGWGKKKNPANTAGFENTETVGFEPTSPGGLPDFECVWSSVMECCLVLSKVSQNAEKACNYGLSG